MDGNFGSTDKVLWAVSIFAGIVMCKIVYEITGLISREFFKGYNSLSKPTKIEWNNRGFSTFHAILVAAISFYLLVLSDLFDETAIGSIVHRKSLLSDSLLGISIGYFLTDFGMILWYFPALGGMEYVLHHVLSMYAIILSLISGQAQYYILMILFSEITTPFVNLRWYLDVYGKKSSMLYICNGVALFLGWLAVRILLFIFFFAHTYLHFEQVKTIFPLGFYSILSVPPLIAVMNAYWFLKIFKGLVKTLSRKRHAQ
ncbi:transmembrane protein 56-B [Phalaenopsis equestris]|uniref:transmembrane protein 56-B n=1 Tax=Phalaenopsis equestris TaxID=78828 RepID=UPI0009E23C25|nr:transmembrane protein 56-B [Phalaenopsis equestris]XP_020580291.1 transmembrane protein 56-B [Phalaenopsis equestris]XP_020580292.1 transmembrane protein 56-B [Phalaenopsis equestris]